MNIARMTARLIIGGLFIGHGTQKLMGWFGGPGIEGTEGMMESLEMHPPKANALAAGLFTPVASAALTGTMITAIRKVHWSKGPWNAGGGYEYNLVLIAALLALAESGPGDLSADAALGLKLTGWQWSLAALGTGAAASSLAVAMGRKNAPEPAKPIVEPGTESPS